MTAWFETHPSSHSPDSPAPSPQGAAIGSEPISGFIEDGTGRHAFAGWIDLVDAMAASAERRNGGLTNAP